MRAELPPFETNIHFNLNAPEQVEFDDKPQDECGVFGVFAPGEDVATMTYDALHRLQHRGQSGAGLLVFDKETGLYYGTKGTGLINKALAGVVPGASGRSFLDEQCRADIAVGHVRYSTANSEDDNAAGPGLKNTLAVSHNGHIEGMEDQVGYYGVGEKPITDSHGVTLILAEAKERLANSTRAALKVVLPKLNGGYSLVVSDGKELFGARDPWGTHPLVLGELPDGKGYTLASEARAFEAIGATFVRDIERGEIVTIGEKGVESFFMGRQEAARKCMFEYIYITNPLSIVDGSSVYRTRHNLGKYLAIDQPADADVVVGVPDSGKTAAEGYATQAGLPMVEGLVKDRYENGHRTFIERGDKRQAKLARKWDANPEALAGKRVVLVDDSVIKGNTMRQLIQQLRDAGATEVHVRSSAPEYNNACFSGMDTRETWRLVARGRTSAEIAEELGADSIGFNSVDRVEQAVRDAAIDKEGVQEIGRQLCHACHDGEYPFPVPGLNKEDVVTLPNPRKDSVDVTIALA